MQVKVGGQTGYWNGKYYSSSKNEVRIYIEGKEIHCAKSDIIQLHTNTTTEKYHRICKRFITSHNNIVKDGDNYYRIVKRSIMTDIDYDDIEFEVADCVDATVEEIEMYQKYENEKNEKKIKAENERKEALDEAKELSQKYQIFADWSWDNYSEKKGNEIFQTKYFKVYDYKISDGKNITATGIVLELKIEYKYLNIAAKDITDIFSNVKYQNEHHLLKQFVNAA